MRMFSQCMCKFICNVLYLFGGPCIRRSSLAPGYPPSQRPRVAPPQLSWFWFLWRNELNQLNEQPLRQLLLPVRTQRLLPLQSQSRKQSGL